MTQDGVKDKEPRREAGTVRGGSGGKHEAEEIGRILTRWLSRNRARERVRKESIYALWKEIVGEEVACSTRVIRLQAGVLTVEVSTAPLLNELATYRRKEILERVRSREEFRGVREIRFRAGASGSAP